MKKFKIPCHFAEQKIPFDIYVGEPSPQHHPLGFQSIWLQEERGGSIPVEVMDSFEKLQKIALENNVSFEDLCVYAFGAASESNKPDSKPENPKAPSGE